MIQAQAPDFESGNDTIIGNVGGGNVARDVYRVVSFAHDKSAIGGFRRPLLHKPREQQAAMNTKKRKLRGT
jgi:hypothetical protein